MMMTTSRIICAALLLLAGDVALRASDGVEPKPAVKIETTDWKGVLKEVARHRGKVVVVDIWTTTCGKCREDFPDFVAFGDAFSEEDVVLISVNCDYDGIETKPPSFYEPQVHEFLVKNNAHFAHFLLNVSLLDFMELIDLKSTPAMYVFNRQGKVARRFDNDDIENFEDEFKLATVKELVTKLVRKQKSETGKRESE